MSLTTIVSYDGTRNDDDALTLAHVLGDAGAKLVLAYVRHDAHARDGVDAQTLLDRGVASLGNLGNIDVETRVVVHASTSEVL